MTEALDPDAGAVEFRARPYQGRADLLAMIDLVQAGAEERARGRGGLRSGDLIWRMFRDKTFVPEKNVQLLVDAADRLLAFALLYRYGGGYALDAQALSACSVGPRLQEAIIQWAEDIVRAECKGDEASRIITSAAEGNGERIALLQRLGFRRTEDCSIHLSRSLKGEIPAFPLANGFVIRSVRPDELAERVRLHQQTLGLSYSREAHQRIHNAPTFQQDLDLVAVAPDGTLAGFGLFWLDSRNREGELEPLAVLPAYRGRGLGKGIILEGLARLREKGAESAVVLAAGDEHKPARRLYASLGFHELTREYDYVKVVPRY